jgi:hypothetical protein
VKLWRAHALLSCLLLATPVLAQEPAADGAGPGSRQTSAAQAKVALNRGIELRKAGDDRGALDAFERAYALTASAEARAQAALAEQALGRWVEAREHLQEALAQSNDPWIVEHRKTLVLAQEEIDSRLGVLEVSCNIAGAQVYVDDRLRGRTPLAEPLRLIAGQSVLKLSARGHFDLVRQVQVDAHGLARVDVTLTPLPSEPSATVPASAGVATRDTSRDMLLYTSVGLAAVGASVGLTGYVIREVNVRKYNDDTRCAQLEDVRRSDECRGEYSAWRRGETIAIAGFAAGGVFGGLALYLWLDRAGTPEPPRVSCGIAALSAGCSGTF